jgi:hypothetical protein
VTQFRIQGQPPTGRVIRTIDLDTANEHEVAHLISDVTDADLVLMIVGAGNNAHAVEIIGEACSARRVMTHTIIVRAAQATHEALSRTLAQVRPWSLMVVVANEDDYVDDILKSFR